MFFRQSTVKFGKITSFLAYSAGGTLLTRASGQFAHIFCIRRTRILRSIPVLLSRVLHIGGVCTDDTSVAFPEAAARAKFDTTSMS